MILNKPYLYVSKAGKRAYQLSILVRIPDGSDIGQFRRIDLDDKILLVAVRVPVHNQVHASFKEQIIWLDNVEEGTPIEVRIEEAIFTGEERKDGDDRNQRKIQEKINDRDSDILGRTIIIPTDDDGRPGSSEDEEDRTNN